MGASARYPRNRQIAGLALILSTILVVTLILKAFSGDFSDSVRVEASVAAVGDALENGDAVKYRDITVGEVDSFAASGNRGARLSLVIQSRYARVIPADVTAIAVPTSLFGATAVQLIPPARSAGGHLRHGSVVSADVSKSAAGLQTTLADTYALMTAIRPAELNAALSALATALEGNGENLAQMVVSADDYLKALAPHLPQLEKVINRFATTTADLAHNSPQLLQAVGNLLTPATAVLKKQDAIRALLAVAPEAVSNADSLIGHVGNAYVTVIANEGPVLRAMGAHPDSLGASVRSFHELTDAVNSVFHNGRPAATVYISGINIAELVNLVAGRPTGVFKSISDPPTYTASDCPQYPGAASQSCSGSARAVKVTTADNNGSGVGSAGSASEVSAVQMIVSNASGISVQDVPPAVDLILGPVLRGTTAVLL